MKTISIANQKGGCGKTTTAINLSGAIADSGKNVLLIDLDPQSHASFGLGVISQSVDKSIYNVLTDNPEKRRTVHDCISNVSKNLDIIPSNILLSTLEQELKDKEDAVSKLHLTLSANQLNYNYIIIDCPPSLGFLTFNALRAADIVIVPIDMSAFSLMGVGKLLGMLELIKVRINHSPRVHALATLFDKRTKYSQTMLNDIRAFFKAEMMETVIRMNVALKKAAADGVSVIQFDRKSNGATDHLALAQEILKTDGALEFEQALESAISNTSDVATREAPRIDAARIPARVLATVPRGDIPQEVPGPEAALLDKPPARETAFAINAPNAKDVYLVGDFNHWRINDDSRLSRLEDGKWEKSMALSPGKYRYKFIVDGEWVLDSKNPEREPNPFGTFDSIMKLA